MLSLGKQPVELRQEVALPEGLLELGEERADMGQVERAAPAAQDRPHVLDVLRAAGEDLQNHQVLDANHGNGAVPDVDGDRSVDAVVLEAGGAENDVEAEAGRLMKEGEDCCPFDEVVEIGNAQRQPRGDEGGREGARVSVCRDDCHIDVAGRPGKPVGDDGLGTEQEPTIAATEEDFADEREEPGGVRRERHGAEVS